MNFITKDIPLQRSTSTSTTIVSSSGGGSGSSSSVQYKYLQLDPQSSNLITNGTIALSTSLGGLYGSVTGSTANYLISNNNGWIFRNGTTNKNIASVDEVGKINVTGLELINDTKTIDLSINADGNMLISGSDMTDKPVIQSIIDGVFQDLLINPNGGNVSINTEYSEGYQLNVNGTIKSHNITVNGGSHNNVLSTDAIDGSFKLNGQPLGARIYKIDELISGTFSSEDISNSVNAYVGKNLLQRVTAIETTGSQPVFNGTGFVKVNGSVISYDNNSYLTGINEVMVTNALGYLPVKQGGGIDQTNNNVYIGWSNAGKVKVTIDSTNIGNILFEGKGNSLLTNDSGFITSSSLNGYLSLNGGSMNNTNMVNGLNAQYFNNQPINNFHYNSDNYYSSRDANTIIGGYGLNTTGNGTGNNNFPYGYGTVMTYDLGYAKTQLQFNYTGELTVRSYWGGNWNANRVVWDSGNFNPANYLLKTGDYMTGRLEIYTTEALRVIQDNGYLSFFNSAGTTRNGYIQVASNSVYIAAESGSGDIALINKNAVIIRNDVGGEARVQLTGSQGSAKQYSIKNSIYGISNTGFSIRNDSDSTTPFYIDGSDNSTFSGNGNFGGGLFSNKYLSLVNSSDNDSDGNPWYGLGHKTSNLVNLNGYFGIRLKTAGGYTDFTSGGNIDASGGLTTTYLDVAKNLNTPAIRLRTNSPWDSAIGHDSGGGETVAFMAKNVSTNFKFKVGFDPASFGVGIFRNMANADFEIGNGYAKIAGNDVIHTGNISSQSVNYANTSGGSNRMNYIDINNTSANQVEFYQSSSNNPYNDNPTGSWATMFKMSHGDGNTYYNRRLAFPFWGNDVYVGGRTGGSETSWEKLIHSKTIGTFWTGTKAEFDALSKDGNTMYIII